jgi:RNA polymerase sigma factor (sigma-70 family)
MTGEEDLHVLERSLREPAAFDVLFARHHIAIRRYLHARLGDPALAEDLAAETFARAFASRGRFRDQGHGVRAWLFSIATNLLLDELRARGRRSRYVSHGPASAAAPALPSDPALSALLRDLPPAQLEVLLLHAWGDLSYEGIAAVLGVRVGTVRSRLSRARARLQRAMTQPTTADAGSVQAKGTTT